MKPQQLPKVGIIISAFNEGSEVNHTIRSFSHALKDSGVEFKFYIVNDNSTDGCCNNLPKDVPLNLIQTEKAGVSGTRNRGFAEALRDGMDVVGFFDAHARVAGFNAGKNNTEKDESYSGGKILTPILKANEGEAIINIMGGSWFEKNGKEKINMKYGADLFYTTKDLFQAKFLYGSNNKPGNYHRIPCLMGACYFIQRDLAKQMCLVDEYDLWPNYHGLWGGSEQALSIKAFLMDIPLRVDTSLHINHLYRGRNPLGKLVPVNPEKFKGYAYCLYLMFDKKLADDKFSFICKKYIRKDGEFENLRRKGIEDRAKIEIPWNNLREHKVFSHLIGKKSKVTEAHPDHEFWADSTNFTLPHHRNHHNLTALFYRPNELVYQLAYHLDNFEAVCLEHHRETKDLWRGVFDSYPNVKVKNVSSQQFQSKSFIDTLDLEKFEMIITHKKLVDTFRQKVGKDVVVIDSGNVFRSQYEKKRAPKTL